MAMILGDFIKEYDIRLRYSQDRSLLERNVGVEVLAYVVCHSGKFVHNWAGNKHIVNFDDTERRAYAFAFIIKTKRLLVGFANSRRYEPSVIYKFIKGFQAKRDITNKKELEQELLFREI